MTWRLPPQAVTDVAPTASTVSALVQMRRRHVRDVLTIERLVYPRPWSRELFLSELAQSHTRRYLVALDGRRLVGYAGAMVVVDEAHVTTVAVHPERRRSGIGSALLTAVLASAWTLGARSATLEVRPSNAAALHLYERFGFVREGVRRRYYEDNGEDAVIMWLRDLTPALGPATGTR